MAGGMLAGGKLSVTRVRNIAYILVWHQVNEPDHQRHIESLPKRCEVYLNDVQVEKRSHSRSQSSGMELLVLRLLDGS